ncbi:MAG: AMP-binding protein, partial [Pseudomonadota bacterium]
MASSSSATAQLVSIPALLARNASAFAASPAYREKELGIWQSWTWAETAAEIEALALGLLTLGVAEGDHIAIIGRNRPYLYWSIVAAQHVGHLLAHGVLIERHGHGTHALCGHDRPVKIRTVAPDDGDVVAFG